MAVQCEPRHTLVADSRPCLDHEFPPEVGSCVQRVVCGAAPKPRIWLRRSAFARCQHGLNVYFTENCHDVAEMLLSTCKRCRRLRRKCDKLLPHCRNCQKAGAECTLYDHALEQTLPRAYVLSLLTRLEHLKALKFSRESSATSAIALVPTFESAATVVDDLEHPPAGFPNLTTRQIFDKHFAIPVTSVTENSHSRFFGASSVFALTVEVLHHATKKGMVQEPESEQPRTMTGTHKLASNEFYHLSSQPHHLQDTVRSLFNIFFVSSNTLYGILDPEECQNDIDHYLVLRNVDQLDRSNLDGDSAHRFFRISLVCAIAAATKSRYHVECKTLAKSFYRDALSCVEGVTSEVSVASLQALLLLTVFCLFCPQEGDIWKLLDYSCRLCVELGYHTEPQTADSETDVQRRLRRSTFWGLYAIERIVGQLFGRPSDLPESIITTEYPNSVSDFDESMDQATVQPLSIAHHYRLVYLRSELFRDMYMPARAILFDRNWYMEQYNTLYLWRQEFAVPDDLAGVATITCDVGYHSSICFLFQPLMLSALRETEKSAEDQIDTTGVPQENYYSACELIATYEKVMRAPPSAPLGSYPITFLSAHYMYLAGMTVMAHALLAIDGRIVTYSYNEGAQVKPLDFSNVIGVSNSALVLLSHCAEQWDGMDGMLSSYKMLADKTIRALVRKRLV